MKVKGPKMIRPTEKRTILLSIIASVLWLGACSDESDDLPSTGTQADETDQSISEHANRAFEEAKTAAALGWESFTEYSREKKDDAVAFLDKKTENLDDQLDALEDRSERVADQSKEAYRKSLDALRVKYEELEVQTEKLKNASSETWEETKLETKKKWNAFTEEVEAFAERFD